jgi:hypothetical protein
LHPPKGGDGRIQWIGHLADRYFGVAHASASRSSGLAQ